MRAYLPLGLVSLFIAAGCGSDAVAPAGGNAGAGAGDGQGSGQGGAGAAGQVATGGSGQGTGGTAQGGAGGAEPIADPGPVVVRVFDDGALAADVPVVFHGPDGAVVSHGITSSDGEAHGVLPPGSMVTVALSKPKRELHTFAGVEPGDVLIAGDTTPSTIAGTVSVSIPSDVEGATDYIVDVGCESRIVESLETPVLFEVPVVCATGGDSTAVLVVARKQGVPQLFATARDVSLAVGTPALATLSPWGNTFDSIFLRVMDFPAGAHTVVAGLGVVRHGIAYRAYQTGQASPVPMQTATFVFGAPEDDFVHAYELTAGVAFSDDGGGTIDGESLYINRDPDRDDRIDVKVSSQLLGRVSALANDTSEPARPRLSWTHNDEGDGALVVLNYPDGAWRVVTSGKAQDVRLPELPTELAEWRKTTAPSNVSITLVEADYIDGYAEMRQRFGHRVLNLPLPADATMRFSATRK